MSRDTRSDTPLFSVTKADLRIETFRCGGPGGQKQNKTESGVRIVHLPSRATAESRTYRTQLENKKAAFQRLLETPEFRAWMKAETMRRLGTTARIESEVAASMAPRNIRTEVHDPAGRWVETEL